MWRRTPRRESVAGNLATSRIMDEGAFRTWVGTTVPWSNEHHLAAMGVEYRNDLLGHFHAFGPRAAPSRFCTGHLASDHPVDHPANAVAAGNFRISERLSVTAIQSSR